MQSPTELAEAFRARGLKVTPQRQLLFTLLEDDTTHPTADGLYARVPTIRLIPATFSTSTPTTQPTRQ